MGLTEIPPPGLSEHYDNPAEAVSPSSAGNPNTHTLLLLAGENENHGNLCSYSLDSYPAG
jgi:hypothetical protein